MKCQRERQCQSLSAFEKRVVLYKEFARMAQESMFKPGLLKIG